MKCPFSQQTKKQQLDSTLATDFYAKLGTDSVLAEHNGAYSTFKNILTGLQIHAKTFEKQTLILATSQDQEEALF
jgi:hypothetical protein